MLSITKRLNNFNYYNFFYHDLSFIVINSFLNLADIFKSIPSLAIFILPGGAVLLPIFIKLIPKLLPSAFDENRVE